VADPGAVRRAHRTLVLVVFIGESVREAFDPKQYARYE